MLKRVQLIVGITIEAAVFLAIAITAGPMFTRGLTRILEDIWQPNNPWWTASMQSVVVLAVAALLIHNVFAVIQAIPLPWKKAKP